MSAVLRAPALRPRDRVAVVAPGGPLTGDEASDLDRGIGVLRAWGLHPVIMPHVHAQHGHLAGTDEQRLADLNEALTDRWFRGVFVARGGYGTTRILDGVDWDALVRDPRLLVGFSDATALLAGAWRHAGVVGVHGQFAVRLHRLPPPCREHLYALLFDAELQGPLPLPDGAPAVATIAPGSAEGLLLGGNLEVLRALVGTPHLPDLAGAIVFLEEINEAPYRVDRTLTHLLGAGVFDGVAGIVVGECRGCDPPEGRPSADLVEVVRDRLGGLGVPVAYGLSIGHVDRQVALPVGARARLDADAGDLTLLEPAVRAG